MSRTHWGSEPASLGQPFSPFSLSSSDGSQTVNESVRELGAIPLKTLFSKPSSAPPFRSPHPLSCLQPFCTFAMPQLLQKSGAHFPSLPSPGASVCHRRLDLPFSPRVSLPGVGGEGEEVWRPVPHLHLELCCPFPSLAPSPLVTVCEQPQAEKRR